MAQKNDSDEPIRARLGDWIVELPTPEVAAEFFSRLGIGGVRVKPAPAFAVAAATGPKVRVNEPESPFQQSREEQILAFFTLLRERRGLGVESKDMQTIFGVAPRGLGPVMGHIRGKVADAGLTFATVAKKAKVSGQRRWVAGVDIEKAIEKLRPGTNGTGHERG